MPGQSGESWDKFNEKVTPTGRKRVWKWKIRRGGRDESAREREDRQREQWRAQLGSAEPGREAGKEGYCGAGPHGEPPGLEVQDRGLCLWGLLQLTSLNKSGSWFWRTEGSHQTQQTAELQAVPVSSQQGWMVAPAPVARSRGLCPQQGGCRTWGRHRQANRADWANRANRANKANRANGADRDNRADGANKANRANRANRADRAVPSVTTTGQLRGGPHGGTCFLHAVTLVLVLGEVAHWNACDSSGKRFGMPNSG